MGPKKGYFNNWVGETVQLAQNMGQNILEATAEREFIRLLVQAKMGIRPALGFGILWFLGPIVRANANQSPLLNQLF